MTFSPENDFLFISQMCPLAHEIRLRLLAATIHNVGYIKMHKHNLRNKQTTQNIAQCIIVTVEHIRILIKAFLSSTVGQKAPQIHR